VKNEKFKKGQVKIGTVVILVIIALLIGIVRYLFSIKPKETKITPYAGKQVDIVMNNNGMNFVGTHCIPFEH